MVTVLYYIILGISLQKIINKKMFLLRIYETKKNKTWSASCDSGRTYRLWVPDCTMRHVEC